MIELSNQECRDLKGSLSDRGCYFDKYGKPTENHHKAVSCSCIGCGKKKGITKVFLVKAEVKGRKIIRPICGGCWLIKEDQ